MCAAPKEKIKCSMNHVILVHGCSSSPITGGRHQLSSKYCPAHHHLAQASTSVSDDHSSLRVQIPLRLLGINCDSTPSVSMIDPLPDTDSDELLVGCRKPRNVNRFHDRTAGAIASVR